MIPQMHSCHTDALHQSHDQDVSAQNSPRNCMPANGTSPRQSCQEVLHPCGVCGSEMSIEQGIMCPAAEGVARHFACDECFDAWVLSESVPADEHVPKDAGEIWCVCKRSKDSDAGCSSGRPFTQEEVELHVKPSTFNAYLKARTDAEEAQLARQQHQEHVAALEEKLRDQLDLLDPSAADLHHHNDIESLAEMRTSIIEQIFTLHCPRCGAAFLDFDGCVALWCRMPGCGCGFCGVCLEDCGGDAHGHCWNHCKYVPEESPSGDLHLDGDQLARALRRWRIDKLKEVLLPSSQPMRTAVVASLERELSDLGINPHEVEIEQASN